MYEGASGGVLLHVIDEAAASRGDLEVKYLYFDVFYAGAVASGLWSPKKFTQQQAKELLRKIQSGGHGERLKLPKSAFLPIVSPASILALRFHLPSPTNYQVLVAPSCKSAEEGEDLGSFSEVWQGGVLPWVDRSAV